MQFSSKPTLKQTVHIQNQNCTSFKFRIKAQTLLWNLKFKKLPLQIKQSLQQLKKMRQLTTLRQIYLKSLKFKLFRKATLSVAEKDQKIAKIWLKVYTF